jgi:hypothetical protein
MITNLESNYDCANAGADLHSLKEELQELKSGQTGGPTAKETQERINRIENQISFIENKCSIPPKG